MRRRLVSLVLEGEITTRANKSQALATLPTFVKKPDVEDVHRSLTRKSFFDDVGASTDTGGLRLSHVYRSRRRQDD